MGVSPVTPREQRPPPLKEGGGAGFSGTVSENYAEKSADVSAEKALRNSPRNDIPLQNSSVKNSIGIPVLLKQALISMGLKSDNLNRALLVFARFFSVDSGPAAGRGLLLKELRREVLNAAAAEVTPDNAENPEISKVESRALAAAALADKGVKLNPDAFERYARILDGQDFSGDSAEDNGSRKHSGNGGQGAGESSYGSGAKENSEKEPDAEELRLLFDNFMGAGLSPESGGAGERLRFLNRIPGKNGQRWVVWPFKTKIKGVELSVLLRLLIQEPVSTGRCRLFLNIAGPSNSWSFVLDKSGGETLKASISVFPERPRPGLEKIKREAEKFLASFGPLNVQVGNGGQFPSMANFLEKEVLLSVNEEV